MTHQQTKRMISLALKLVLFLGCFTALTVGFNRPVQTPLRTSTTTIFALGLQRPQWWILSRTKTTLRNRNGTTGRQVSGLVDDMAPEVSSAREQMEAQWEKQQQEQSTSLLEDTTIAQESTAKAATLPSSTMNLIKVIMGTGVLALPNGLAAVSDHPMALLPASALLVVLGLFGAYTFQLYGKLTHETQTTNMGEMWEKTVGKKSAWVISASTFSFCFGCALMYSLVIGDFLTSLAMSLFGSGLPALLAKRQFWILSVTLSILAPLSSLKSLTALAPMSVIGTAGTLLTTLFMAFRCPAIVASSPYSVAPGAIGAFAAASLKAAPSLAPQFNTFSKLISPAALIIASMATTAYLGHFNAPDLYNGFKTPTSKTSNENEATSNDNDDATASAASAAASNDSEQAMRNFTKMAGIGFAGVTVWNIIILALGFLTFGGNSAGVILNNYAAADKGAVVSRLLMTLSVIGSYPFMVRACKSNFVQLCSDFQKEKVEANKSNLEKWVGRSLMGIVTSLALLVSDAGLVVSLNGALMGSAIIYIFPAMMHLSHTGKQIKVTGGSILSRKLKLERFASRFLATFGAVAGLIGAAVSVVNSCAPHLLL